MKIITSQHDQSKVQEIISKTEVYVPGTFVEGLKVAITELPFTALYYLYCYQIIKIRPFWDVFYNKFMIKEHESFLDAAQFILRYGACLGALIICGMIVIAALTKPIRKRIKKYVSTPCIQKSKDNIAYIRSLENLKDLLDLQDAIVPFAETGTAKFICADEDKLEIIVQNDNFYEKKEFKVTPELMHYMRKNDALDFTYLDYLIK